MRFLLEIEKAGRWNLRTAIEAPTQGEAIFKFTLVAIGFLDRNLRLLDEAGHVVATSSPDSPLDPRPTQKLARA